MDHQTPTSIQAVKLPLKVKLTYGAGSFAKTLLVYLTMVFMLYFYTDVIGISRRRCCDHHSDRQDPGHHQ